MDIEQTHQSARSMSATDSLSRLQLSRNRDISDHSRQHYDSSYPSDQGPGPATLETTPPRFISRSRPRYVPHAPNRSAQEGVDCLTAEETIELFTRKIEDARKETQYVFAGTENVSNALKPTLTIDLGRTRIERLPDAIIDLIIADVERLSLSHNYLRYIPARIAECSQLRYLNIRSNDFKEIPPSIYRMPLLEILDVSKNKITTIPPEIRKLEALRVFSIVHNRLENLPVELAELPRLKVLKVADNPFRKSIKRVIQDKEAEVAYPEMLENERDTALTTEIVKYLRGLKPSSNVTPLLESTETMEPSSETLRPARRALSGRFPVIPAAAPLESPSESQETMSQQNKPSLPVKSHLRGLSGQSIQGGLLKRPGIAPLISGNERNRSNSESVIQASATARQKRMGMVRRDRTELDSIDETKVIRQSHLHLRGYSYSSSIRRNGSISSPGAASSSPNSPRDTRRDRNQLVRRLSSLPEHKTDLARRPLVEGVKGILYAIYQVHPHISGLIAASKSRDNRKTPLEMTFYQASLDVDKLNRSLEYAEQIDPEDEESWDRLEETLHADCAICVRSYLHVISQMQESTRKIVAGTDPRYVRSLMLLLYGSMVEIRNAIKCFGVDLKHHRRQMSSGATHPIATIPEEATPPEISEMQAAPDRDLDAMTIKPPPRTRRDTVLKHPTVETSILQPVQPPTLQIPNKIGHAGPTINGTYGRSTSALGGAPHKSFAARSRSNSQNINSAALSDSQTSTNTGTPRSIDSHNLPPMSSMNVRLNADTGLTDAQEEQRFEQIFVALTKSYEVALQAVPITTQQLRRCLDAANEQRQSKEILDIWNALIQKSKDCYDLTQALQLRLGNMKLKDSGVGLSSAEGGRHDPSFWTLCKCFLQSFIILVTEMKEVRKMQLLVLPQEIVGVLRPVQKACRDAGLSINTSPWSHMFQGVTSMPAPTPFATKGSEVSRSVDHNRAANGANGNVSSYSLAMSKQVVNQAQQLYHMSATKNQVPSLASLQTPSLQTSGSASAGSGASPLSAQMPPTPLSAALGSAIQATVPSTPASLYGDSFFKGDVFQRADSLLSMPQAPGANFLNRR